MLQNQLIDKIIESLNDEDLYLCEEQLRDYEDNYNLDELLGLVHDLFDLPTAFKLARLIVDRFIG